MSTDAIVVLKDEHKEIRALFGDFQGAGSNATVTKGKVAAKIIENVTHHMDEEENDWLPKVRKGVSRGELQEIGARILEARKTAPRSPAQPGALKKVVDAVMS